MTVIKVFQTILISFFLLHAAVLNCIGAELNVGNRLEKQVIKLQSVNQRRTQNQTRNPLAINQFSLDRLEKPSQRIGIAPNKTFTVNIAQRTLGQLTVAGDANDDTGDANNKEVCAQTPKIGDWCLLNDEGNVVSIKQFLGKPFILHFWATWCPYCKKLQPGIKALNKKFTIDVVAVSWNEYENANPKIELLSRGMDFISLVEGDNVASLYKVTTTPVTYVIDKDGELIYMTNSSDPTNPDLIQAVTRLYE